jgi:hypothetical protein
MRAEGQQEPGAETGATLAQLQVKQWQRAQRQHDAGHAKLAGALAQEAKGQCDGDRRGQRHDREDQVGRARLHRAEQQHLAARAQQAHGQAEHHGTAVALDAPATACQHDDGGRNHRQRPHDVDQGVRKAVFRRQAGEGAPDAPEQGRDQRVREPVALHGSSSYVCDVFATFERKHKRTKTKTQRRKIFRISNPACEGRNAV